MSLPWNSDLLSPEGGRPVLKIHVSIPKIFIEQGHTVSPVLGTEDTRLCQDNPVLTLGELIGQWESDSLIKMMIIAAKRKYWELWEPVLGTRLVWEAGGSRKNFLKKWWLNTYLNDT